MKVSKNSKEVIAVIAFAVSMYVLGLIAGLTYQASEETMTIVEVFPAKTTVTSKTQPMERIELEQEGAMKEKEKTPQTTELWIEPEDVDGIVVEKEAPRTTFPEPEGLKPEELSEEGKVIEAEPKSVIKEKEALLQPESTQGTAKD
jgi:hypothetical protein